jgi:hypothetical protein
MSLGEVLVTVWRQVLRDGRAEIETAFGSYRVVRTRSLGLRTVAFAYGEHLIEGIEQNPEKTSRWAELAREGGCIMQFSCNHRYFANVSDGLLTRYPAWKRLGLPD